MALLSTSATLWLYLGCAAAGLKRRVAPFAASLGALYALWALWGAGILPVRDGEDDEARRPR